MRRRAHVVWAVLWGALLLGGGLANAAEPARKIELSPFFGGFLFDHDLDVGHKGVGGARLGYWLNDKWSLELSGEGVSSRTTDGRPLDYIQGHVDALYHLNYRKDQKLLPYLAVGAGVANYQYLSRINPDYSSRTDFDFLTNWGGGLKYLLTDWFALRVDARQPISWNRTNHHFMYTGGFSLLFGGKSAPPPPADSDGDGVPDDRDKCPDTPAGVTVDADGCPLDSDGDGVPDYLDKCPGTPAGVKVDASGCPLDSDGDGVPDYLDKCPGTPANVRVDASGCPLDSDGDGVPDHLDKCPGTPRGVRVDASGCPIVLDSDGDGVPDDRDKCPGTPAGVKVDADGCPLDSDGDGVPDYLDKCPGTPAGVKVDAGGCPLDSDGDGVPDYLDKCPGTPAGVKVDASGCPIQVETVELRINFDFDKADVKPEYLPQIEKVAAFLKANPDYTAVIEGHTDSQGPEEYNLRLSARRANAVAKILTDTYGISMERITAQSLGESRPIASNDTPEGRAQNRRIYAYMEKD
ncbi:MAG: OmpA family protein [Thermodesulfobacteriota bacterium]